MLSSRLWRSIADAAVDDPIFRRVSQAQTSLTAPKRRLRLSRALLFLGALVFIAALIHAPGLIVLVLLVPILLITLIVIAPILLPGIALVAGAYLTAEIIGDIFREKRQHTYDLICASTRGALDASLSYATGVLYRGEWFLPLRWGSRLTLRAGWAALGGLSVFALFTAVSGAQALGLEQLRLLLLVLLCLALYYSNMTQTLVLSMLAGLLASSFDLSRHDATVIGVFTTLLLSLLPLLAGGSLLIGLGRLALEPHLLLWMAVEVGALALVVGLRELGIMLLWTVLSQRLEWGRDGGFQREAAPPEALLEAV